MRQFLELSYSVAKSVNLFEILKGMTFVFTIENIFDYHNYILYSVSFKGAENPPGAGAVRYRLGQVR